MDEKCSHDDDKTFQPPAAEEFNNYFKITLEDGFEKSKLSCPWLKVKPPALSLDSDDEVSIIWCVFLVVFLVSFIYFLISYIYSFLLFLIFLYGAL